MTSLLSPRALLVLTVPPDLEDDVVDWLLADLEMPGFTSVKAAGHGGPHHLLSVAEQVTGKQARVQFQIATTTEKALTLLAAFDAEFRGAETHAWAVPLIEMPSVTPEARIADA